MTGDRPSSSDAGSAPSAGAVTYLDHAASTPVRPEALEAMLPWLGVRCGNPSGAHRMAREARTALDDAREVVAEATGVPPGGVVFTSGGTEADNLAVAGAAPPGTIPLCSAVEHHAVLHAVERAGGRSVPVDGAGRLQPSALAGVLEEAAAAGLEVGLVSVMAANNETGVVQPLAALATAIADGAPRALVHTDAVQAANWLDVATVAVAADLVSLSAHKFGGPKGIGALAARDGVAVRSQIVGGGQERNRRSGTQNVAGAVGMAVALRAAIDEREVVTARVRALRDRLAAGLLAAVPGALDTVARGGDPVDRLPNVVHLCLPGVETEALIVLLEQDGVMVSAAASCASGALEASHVLTAMGVPADLAAGSVRLSLGWCSTSSDVDHALAVVPRAVEQLRRVPLRR